MAYWNRRATVCAYRQTQSESLSCQKEIQNGPGRSSGWYSPRLFFAELRSKYGDQLPLSARHTLVTQDFAPHAADEIIRLYRANFEFVRDWGGSETADVGKPERREGAPPPEIGESSMSRGPTYPEATTDRELQFQIGEVPTRASISGDDPTVLPSRS